MSGVPQLHEPRAIQMPHHCVDAKSIVRCRPAACHINEIRGLCVRDGLFCLGYAALWCPCALRLRPQSALVQGKACQLGSRQCTSKPTSPAQGLEAPAYGTLPWHAAFLHAAACSAALGTHRVWRPAGPERRAGTPHGGALCSAGPNGHGRMTASCWTWCSRQPRRPERRPHWHNTLANYCARTRPRGRQQRLRRRRRS